MRPAQDAMLMMLPDLRSRIAGNTALIAYMTPLRFTPTSDTIEVSSVDGRQAAVLDSNFST